MQCSYQGQSIPRANSSITNGGIIQPTQLIPSNSIRIKIALDGGDQNRVDTSRPVNAAIGKGYVVALRHLFYARL